jgi:hypothetical protein
MTYKPKFRLSYFLTNGMETISVNYFRLQVFSPKIEYSGHHPIKAVKIGMRPIKAKYLAFP